MYENIIWKYMKILYENPSAASILLMFKSTDVYIQKVWRPIPARFTNTMYTDSESTIPKSK